MAKKSFIFVLLFTLVGSIFFYFSYLGISPELFPPVKKFISEIEKSTGEKITLTKLRTNFLTNLYLDNLTVYYEDIPTDRFFLKSKTVSLRFSIFSLLAHLKEPSKEVFTLSIKRVTFTEGEIFFTNRYAFSTFLEKKNFLSIFLIPKIYFKNFILKTEDTTGKLPALNIANINGSCLFAEKKIIFNFYGKEWKLNGKIYPEGRGLPRTPNNASPLRAEINGVQNKPSKECLVLQDGVQGLLFQLEGKNFPITFTEWSTRFRRVQGKVDFTVDVRGDNWQEREKWDYQGNALFEKTKIEFADLPFGLNEITAEVIFNEKKCVLNVSEAKLGNSVLQLKGEINAPYENPFFQGKIECASLEVPISNWQTIKINNLSSEINYSSQTLNIAPIEFDFNEGKIKGNFHLNFGKEFNLLQSRGKIKIDNFTINKNLPKLDDFELTTIYRNNKLQVKGEDRKKIYQLKLNAERKPERISIDKFVFAVVPPDKKYPSSNLMFQGELAIYKNKPLLKGKLLSNLRVVSIFLNYPEKEIQGKISAFFEFDSSKENPALSGELKISQGYWKQLSWEEIATSFLYTKDYFNFDKFLIKQKEGKLSFQFNWQSVSSDQQTNISKFTPPLRSGATEPRPFRKERGTAFPNSATISNKGARFTLHSEAENFLWQNNVFNGILDFTGKYKSTSGGLDGDYLISPLKINQINFQKVQGKIRYTDKNLTFFSTIDDFAQIESEINFSPGKEEVKGKLEIQPVDWEKLKKIINPKEEEKSVPGGLKGKFNASLNLVGKLFHPKLSGEFQFQDGNWQGVHPAPSGAYQGVKFFAKGNCVYDFLSPLILEISFSFQEPFSGQAKSKFKITDPLLVLKGDYLLEGIMESEKLSFTKNFILEKTKLKIRNEKKRILLTSFQTKFKESEIYFLDGSYIEKDKFLFLTEIRNLHLANLTLFGKLNLAGEMKTTEEPFKVSTTDTLQGEPFLKATITTNNFWINQHNLQAMKFHLQYTNKILNFLPFEKEFKTFAGEIDFTQYPKIYLNDLTLIQEGKKTFTLQGIFEQDNFTLSLNGEKFPLPVLTELLNQKIPCQGEVDFKLAAKDSLQSPIINGEFNLKNSKLYELSFTTFTTIFRVEKNTFFLENLRIYSPEKYSLTGYGKFPLSKKGQIKMKPLFLTLLLEEGDLSFLKYITPKISESRGKVNGKMIIKGDCNSPQLEGSLSVSDGEIETQNILKKITEFNAYFEFSEQNIFLRSANAKIGRGKIEANGKIELAFSIKDEFPYFKIKDYVFSLKSSTDKGISVVLEDLIIPRSTIFKRLVYAPSQGETKIALSLLKGKNKPILDGFIELSNSHFTYPPKEKETNKTWSEILSLLDFNLEIKTKDNVWYENELVDANINGFLKLTSEKNKIKVNGKIEAVRGNLSYLNRNFEIRKIIFEVIDNVCYLEGVAETKTTVLDPESRQMSPDIIVMSIDRGKIGEIQPKFYSKNYPLLTQEKVLRYVFANVDTSALTPEEQIILFRREILRWLDTSLITPLVKNILTYAGLVDTVRMKRETPEETTEKKTIAPGDLQSVSTDWQDLVKGTKVTFEKQILQNVLLGYSVKLDTLVNRLDLKHELELAYRFRWKGDVLLRATYELERGQATSGSLTPERKIYLEPRWRFGWEE